MPGRVGSARQRLLGAGAGGGSPGASLHHPFKHPLGAGTFRCYLLERDSRKSSTKGPGLHWERFKNSLGSLETPRQVLRSIACALSLGRFGALSIPQQSLASPA